MRRYGLRDDPWERIKDLLPGRPGHVWGDGPEIIGDLWRRYSTAIEPASHGKIYRND